MGSRSMTGRSNISVAGVAEGGGEEGKREGGRRVHSVADGWRGAGEGRGEGREGGGEGEREGGTLDHARHVREVFVLAQEPLFHRGRVVASAREERAPLDHRPIGVPLPARLQGKNVGGGEGGGGGGGGGGGEGGREGERGGSQAV